MHQRRDRLRRHLALLVKQLFLVVSGAGWGVRWDAGEDHTSGTEAGLTAIAVEGAALSLFEPETPDA